MEMDEETSNAVIGIGRGVLWGAVTIVALVMLYAVVHRAVLP
jgi:hypothetical protein